MKVVKNISRYVFFVISILLSIFFVSKIILDREVYADSPIEINYLQDLDDVRNDLTSGYILIRDLDFDDDSSYDQTDPDWATKKTSWTTGDGWEPIGSSSTPFSGIFYAQEYTISNLLVSRGSSNYQGLFGYISGEVRNLALTSVSVTGQYYVGGISGYTNSTGKIDNSYSTGSVTCTYYCGGLVGLHSGTIEDSYSTSSVSGGLAGGLFGYGSGTLNNSYYNIDDVLINGTNKINVGGIYDADYDVWLANGKVLNIDDYLSNKEGDYYLISSLSDFQTLLIFSQFSDLKFKLTTDLDFTSIPDFFIPSFSGELDGNGYEISDISLNYSSDYYIGLFGKNYGIIKNIGVRDSSITGSSSVAALVGYNRGTISNSYSTGSTISGSTSGGLVGDHSSGTIDDCYANNTVSGSYYIGGLVGINDALITDSYALGSVTGVSGYVGGLVGMLFDGSAINSFYNYEEVLINGSNSQGLYSLDDYWFDIWIASGLQPFDPSEHYTTVGEYNIIDSIEDFKLLSIFGLDSSNKFKLTQDIDLSGNPDFYIPYFCGELDGDNHEISNLSLSYPDDNYIGLFGRLASTSTIANLGITDIDVEGNDSVGGLTGNNAGIILNAYATGDIKGHSTIGGLVGNNDSDADISNSYSNVNITIDTDENVWNMAGGFVGTTNGEISNSFSTGDVVALDDGWVGGFAGYNTGIIDACFASGDVNGGSMTGGFVAYALDGGIISNCYALGDVDGNVQHGVGGFTGYIRGSSISNSYSAGAVTGDAPIGAFAARTNNGTVLNSFWDSDTSVTATSVKGTGKTTSEMRNISTFNDTGTDGLDEEWDILGINTFDPSDPTIWYINSGNDYPLLYWQYDQPETTVSVSNIEEYSAKLNGNLTEVGTLGSVKVYFQYRQAGGVWINTSKATKTSTGIYSYSLTDLNPDSNYQYRGVLEYGSTVIDYSNTLSFSSLKVDISKVVITEIGLIDDVLDRDTLLYYFTSTTPTIRGEAYPGSYVKFETEDEEFTTQVDSNGEFEIELDLDTGTNELEYYAYNSFGSQSDIRELTLVIGTGHFPDWLLEKMGLMTPTEDVEEREEEEEQTEDETTGEEGGQEEEESTGSQSTTIRFVDKNDQPLDSATIEIEGVVYITDSNGEIEADNIDSNITYGVTIRSKDGKEFSIEVLGLEEGVSIVKVVEDTSSMDWKNILFYIYIGVVLIIIFVLIFSKREKEFE